MDEKASHWRNLGDVWLTIWSIIEWIFGAACRLFYGLSWYIAAGSGAITLGKWVPVGSRGKTLALVVFAFASYCIIDSLVHPENGHWEYNGPHGSVAEWVENND